MSWDDLESEAKANGRNHQKCGVALMLEAVGEESGPGAADSIRRALANVRLTSASIHKALSSRVSADALAGQHSLNRHRRGACSCPKESS